MGAWIPTSSDVVAYMGDDVSWSVAEIDDELLAQRGDQAKKCTVPTDPSNATWMPAPLHEALCRRVQVGLSLRPIPLAVQTTLTEGASATVRVGSPSQDPLVRDLERPYRKLVVG